MLFSAAGRSRAGFAEASWVVVDRLFIGGGGGGAYCCSIIAVVASTTAMRHGESHRVDESPIRQGGRDAYRRRSCFNFGEEGGIFLPENKCMEN